MKKIIYTFLFLVTYAHCDAMQHVNEQFIDAIGQSDKDTIFDLLPYIDVYRKDEFGATLLHFASMLNMPDLVRLLLDKGSDVNAQDNNGSTPLLVAVENNSVDSIAELLID